MNCPAEFKAKTTVNPWALVLMGGFIWILSSLMIVEILKPFLPPKDWVEVYGLIEKSILGLCLLYLAHTLGINIYAVVQDWWKDRAEHLKVVFKYFLFYIGLIVLVVGLILIVVVLLDKAGAISLSKSMGFFEDTTPDTMGLLKGVMAKSTPQFMLSLFKMCIVAPIIEEVFFRRFLFVALRKKMNFAPSLVISSFLFAVLHPGLLQGALGGFYLGYVYEKSKSLPANILLHSLVNLFIIITDVLIG